MLNTKDLESLVKAIVARQQLIIGPLAIEQANKVPGLKVLTGNGIDITIQNTNSTDVLSKLVEKYEELFGATSVEVCKDAIREVHGSVSIKDLPTILQ